MLPDVNKIARSCRIRYILETVHAFRDKVLFLGKEVNSFFLIDLSPKYSGHIQPLLM